MAVPADLTILNISGVYVMNKTLTDTTATDTILQLQGVSWWTRKAISIGTVTLYIKHYTNTDGPDAFEHIDIDNSLTGGITSTELRTLSWEERENEDKIFGSVIGKSRRVKAVPEEIEEPFLREGWTQDTLEHGVVQSYVVSNTAKSGTTWIGHQTWGMEDINGERRYVRHLKFTGPKEENIETKLIYDYLGPLAG